MAPAGQVLEIVEHQETTALGQDLQHLLERVFPFVKTDPDGTAKAEIKRSSLVKGANGIQKTPSKRSTRSAEACRASRVFPKPPGPTR
jgi:hypothetical protein